ncbi:MAG: hypothetical protein ACI4F7_08675 [Acutalibacteraceae bacterium]
MNGKDLNRIRELAKEQMEIAKSPEMQELAEDWRKLNDCESQKPLVTVELLSFEHEILPQFMKCDTEEGRELERIFLRNIINHKYFGDDTFVSDFIPVYYGAYFKPFDIDLNIENTDGVGRRFIPALFDLESDFNKLKPSLMGVIQKSETEKRTEYLNELFGDIIPAKIVGNALYTVPTQDIVHLMSMENMYLAMYDTPELFHEMMRLLTDDYLKYFDLLEHNGYLLPTVFCERVGQGTYCFTNDLPKENITKTNQIWGFMDSQETAGISPEMYNEFIFPYYKKIMDRYGLLSYGCCEAVDPIWELCISKVKNLRKVSISPWCNEEYMGEQLRGRKTVYHRKPSPNFLGVGKNLDEDGLRDHIRKTLSAAKGCTLEITQRDVYTVNNDIDKVARFVKIIKQEIVNRPIA